MDDHGRVEGLAEALRAATGARGLNFRDWEFFLSHGRVLVAGRAVRVHYLGRWSTATIARGCPEEFVERLAVAGLWPWHDALTDVDHSFVCARCQGVGLLVSQTDVEGAPLWTRCGRCGGKQSRGSAPWSLAEAAALGASPKAAVAAVAAAREEFERGGCLPLRRVKWLPQHEPPWTRRPTAWGTTCARVGAALCAHGFRLAGARKLNDDLGAGALLEVGYPPLPETFRPGEVAPWDRSAFLAPAA